MKPTILTKQLFEGQGKVYAILDGASVPDLLDKLYGDEPPVFDCLYRGELEPDMAEVAPYLVVLQPESKFTEWLAREGWGKHWGIFAVSAADLRTVRTHFRSLLTVYDPSGKPMLFRFYDPRVLRNHLRTCSAEELDKLFGAIERYVVEDEEPKQALAFRLEDGQLKDEKLPLIAATT